MKTRVLALVSTLALSACATTVVTPPTPPAEALGGFQGGEGAGVLPGTAPRLWWRLFDDPVLDAHVERALAANTDLRVALANLEASRATARQADAARLPATVLESGAGPQRADRQPSTSAVPKSGYELGATVAFEIDLFGRLRQAALAAGADAQAVQAARDAAAVTVAGDTVAAYLDLCAAGANLDLARGLLATQERAYALVDEQLKAGETSPLERAQAATLRDQAAAALPGFEADRRRALLRLATLEGRPPAATASFDTPCARLPRVAAPFPVGDGAALLARRPDVRAAERRIAAATWRTGVARADLYPRIQLGGSAGLIGGGTDVFVTPLITWAFPNQAAPRARIAAAEANQRAALATWDGTVLKALEEVEAALSDLQAQARRREALTAAARSSQVAARRAQARHRLGADSYLVVIDAERTRNAAAVQALAADVAIARTQVTLFRALGGGWEAVADSAVVAKR